MKIIRITTDLEMTVHDFPEGTHEAQNHVLRELIGNDCRIYEHVMPVPLMVRMEQERAVCSWMPLSTASMKNQERE